jgi:hypothetical protein
VEVLRPDPTSGLYSVIEILTPLDGVPSNPSDLAVLEGGSELEVVVSSEGLDQLFVFATPGGPESPPGGDVRLPPEGPGTLDIVLPQPPPPPTVAETTAPAGAPLALVITLVAEVLPGGSGAPAEADGGRGSGAPAEADGGRAAVALPAPDAGEPIAANLAGGTDAVEADGEETDAPPKESGVGSGVDERLRQLHLFEWQKEPDADGPLSRNAPEAQPELREVVVAVAQTAAELLPPWLAGTVGAFVGVPDLSALRVVSETPQGATQPAQSPVAAGDLQDGPGPACAAIRDTDTTAERTADQPRPGETTEVIAGDSWQDEHEVVAGGLLLPPEREWLAEKGWLLAFAVGGAAWHLQHRELADPDEQAAADAPRRDRR